MGHLDMETYSYLNSSKLLKDRFNDKKERLPGFSIRAWAKSMGLSSHGPLQQILAGKRTLPKKYLPSLKKSLSLTKKEIDYLSLLIDLEKASSEEEKHLYLSRLKKLRPSNDDVHFLELENYKFFENPLHSIIRTLMERKDFKADPLWIQENIVFKATINEINEVINRLIELGGVEKKGGKLIKLKSAIQNKADVPSMGVKKFHQKMSIIAYEQVMEQEVNEKEFNSMSFNIKKEKVAEAKIRLRDFVNEFISEFQARPEESDLTYQINSQFFRLNKINKENK
ncbi:MAG: hypothetical protein CME61_03800 [Halobacteriovoraceae bacterium]|nr:hypothetical protein [Halobacteriovoraceae bacterium]